MPGTRASDSAFVSAELVRKRSTLRGTGDATLVVLFLVIGFKLLHHLSDFVKLLTIFL